MGGGEEDLPAVGGKGAKAPATSARRWEIGAAPAFLRWREETGLAAGKMESFAEAVQRTVTAERPWSSPPGEVASCLPRVLSRCDNLAFDVDPEVRAYAALHLVDRYGRVLQELEHLLEIGRLPLRRSGVAALEVGAGPAPALYAVRDFYEDLSRWPGRGDWSAGPLRIADALDKGPGWDRFLHFLSEEIIMVRGTTLDDGQLPFRRALTEFTGLDVHAVHHESIASLAAAIQDDFDRADEPISRATAFRFAYEQGTPRPSAYDLISVPNFLTQAEAPRQFCTELRGLMRSLTPGGVLVVMCGVGAQYGEIIPAVEALAASSGLTPIGRREVEANDNPVRRAIVAEQVRGTARQGTSAIAGPVCHAHGNQARQQS